MLSSSVLLPGDDRRVVIQRRAGFMQIPYFHCTPTVQQVIPLLYRAPVSVGYERVPVSYRSLPG